MTLHLNRIQRTQHIDITKKYLKQINSYKRKAKILVAVDNERKTQITLDNEILDRVEQLECLRSV